jgi:hypothetical protein
MFTLHLAARNAGCKRILRSFRSATSHSIARNEESEGSNELLGGGWWVLGGADARCKMNWGVPTGGGTAGHSPQPTRRYRYVFSQALVGFSGLQQGRRSEA